MSNDAFAALRRTAGPDFANLAEEHMKHDLQQSDRDTLQQAAGSLATYATVGSVVGISLGALLAFRIRSMRSKTFKAFRAVEKPTGVQFADGRTEAIPDITPLLKPSTLGDIAAYTFFAAGGLFIGGELGALGGYYSASRTISKDPESKKRIETAFKRLKADVLRKQAEQLEKGESGDKPFF